MKSLVVFCGSSAGHDEVYAIDAYNAGKFLAAEGIRIIYGGAKVGVMGALADGALQHGGEVIGVLPEFLQTKEIAHEGLTKLILTKTMHERKLIMHEMSDGIMALPGGFGTLEELFEMLTWAQLGLHQKPIGLLNTNSFFQPLIEMTHTMVQEGFLKEAHAGLVLHHPEIHELLKVMKSFEPLPFPKWIRNNEET